MPESIRTTLMRWGFNLFPAYRGTGGRITYIAADWREVRVTLPLNWRTGNYVGTIFGGSMYGAVDPLYMVMLSDADQDPGAPAMSSGTRPRRSISRSREQAAFTQRSP